MATTLGIEEIKKKALPVLKEAGVLRSSIFGSIARGQATESSDIDILVELPEGKTLLDFVGLKMNLEDALKRDVDLLTYRSISPLLKDSIIENQAKIL